MFSLLTPFALWLAPLLAVPLVLHFMGRAQPKTRDFPSLLAVRESLQRAMRRHRLKNWLQLILRTLALLCLLLAAAAPVWRRGSALGPPGAAGLLLHNGAYAAVPAEADGGGRTLGEEQQALRAGLDSLTGGNAVTEPLLPETDDPSGKRGVARFGRPAAAAARLLRRMEDRPAAHVFVPVFDARDLAGLADAVRPWLEARPQARLIVIDRTGPAARLNAFGRVRASFERDGMLTLRAPTAARDGRNAPVWLSAGGARAASLRDGIAEVTLPLPDAGWIAGAFSLSESDPGRAAFAYTSVAAAFRAPPPATLCHLGSRGALASLATLGEGGKRLKIRPLAAAADLSGPGAAGCDLLYLADPDDLDAALLARAAAVVRSGGTLVLEAGSRTDPVLWNRNLLAPLGVGRLAAVERSAAPVTVRPQSGGLAALGVRADRWGPPGTVSARIGFLPAEGTAVLLAADAPGANKAGTGNAPVLLRRAAGSGEVFLWTTSLSDPAWSTLGLGPWPALLHQAVLDRSWAAGVEPRAADTDSLVSLPAPEEDAPRVLDPDGNAFQRLRAEPGGWIAGPFDRPGLYRVIPKGASARDATGDAPGSWLAVQLAETDPEPESPDWAGFRAALGETAWRQTEPLNAGKDWREIYGGVRLRLGLLVMAALLLFAEGAASLRLSPSLGTPRD